jgi:hypothetical protein
VIEYKLDGNVYFQGQRTEIAVGKSDEFSLIAQYNAYNIPINQFTKI